MGVWRMRLSSIRNKLSPSISLLAKASRNRLNRSSSVETPALRKRDSAFLNHVGKWLSSGLLSLSTSDCFKLWRPQAIEGAGTHVRCWKPCAVGVWKVCKPGVGNGTWDDGLLVVKALLGAELCGEKSVARDWTEVCEVFLHRDLMWRKNGSKTRMTFPTYKQKFPSETSPFWRYSV